MRQAGSIEAGHFAGIIAVAGDPLTDIGELRRVRFVMKGGEVAVTIRLFSVTRFDNEPLKPVS